MKSFPLIVITLISLSLPTFVCANWTASADTQWVLSKSYLQNQGDLIKDSYKGKENLKMDDIKITTRFPVTTKNINLLVDYQITPLQKVSFGKPMHIQTTKLALDVTIENITVKHKLSQNIGSGQVITELNAVCKNVKLRQNSAKTSFTSDVTLISMAGKIKSKLKNVKIFWPKSSWQVVDLKCIGLNGFDKIARFEILKFLKDPKNLHTEIEVRLKKMVKKWAANLTTNIFSIRDLAISAPNIKGTIIPLKITENKNFVTMKSFTEIAYDNIKGHPHTQIPVKARKHNVNAKAYTVIPQKLIKRSLFKLFDNGNLTIKDSTKNWTEFNDLLKKPAQLKSIWPHLATFPKDSEFQVKITVVNRPSLKKLSSKLYKIRTYVTIHIYAPHNGQYFPYAEFYTFLKADLSFWINQGDLNFTLKNLVTRNNGWKGGIISQYKKVFSVQNDDIDKVTISDYLSDMISKRSHKMKIPYWNIGENLSLRAKELQSSKNIFYLIWEQI